MAWDSAGLSVLAIDRSRVVVNPGRGRFAYSHESRCRDCALSVNGQDEVLSGGLVTSAWADSRNPCWWPGDLRGGQVKAFTPLPARACWRRWEAPWVVIRGAWGSNPSTVAVGRVLGLMVAEAGGGLLLVTAIERPSLAACPLGEED